MLLTAILCILGWGAAAVFAALRRRHSGTTRGELGIMRKLAIACGMMMAAVVGMEWEHGVWGYAGEDWSGTSMQGRVIAAGWEDGDV